MFLFWWLTSSKEILFTGHTFFCHVFWTCPSSRVASKFGGPEGYVLEGQFKDMYIDNSIVKLKGVLNMSGTWIQISVTAISWLKCPRLACEKQDLESGGTQRKRNTWKFVQPSGVYFRYQERCLKKPTLTWICGNCTLKRQDDFPKVWNIIDLPALSWWGACVIFCGGASLT